MTYEHMHAAEQRENAKLHDRIAELEAEVASLRAELTGTAGAAAHTMNDLLIRAADARGRVEHNRNRAADARGRVEHNRNRAADAH
jgi:hypothetical protein